MEQKPKVMEFCDQSWNSYQFCPRIVLNLYFLGQHYKIFFLYFLFDLDIANTLKMKNIGNTA